MLESGGLLPDKSNVIQDALPGPYLLNLWQDPMGSWRRVARGKPAARPLQDELRFTAVDQRETKKEQNLLPGNLRAT